MKTRDVDTITSNEGHVRCRIYDGDLGIDEAAAELIRLERAQADAERLRYRMMLDRLRRENFMLRNNITGWPE